MEHSAGCEIDGTAVFRHDGAPARLSYHVACDVQWHTRVGAVRGFAGSEEIDLLVERSTSGAWTFNGELVGGLEDCLHLDFGFTPATNFSQLRQLDLAVGQSAELPVAWLDVPAAGVQLLAQRYQRRTAAAYWYEAPSVGYSGLLEMTPAGFVRRYPGLWEIAD
jgi:hypothetical protein